MMKKQTKTKKPSHQNATDNFLYSISINPKEVVVFSELECRSHRESSGYVSLQISPVLLIPQSAIMLVY